MKLQDVSSRLGIFSSSENGLKMAPGGYSSPRNFFHPSRFSLLYSVADILSRFIYKFPPDYWRFFPILSTPLVPFQYIPLHIHSAIIRLRSMLLKLLRLKTKQLNKFNQFNECQHDSVRAPCNVCINPLQ